MSTEPHWGSRQLLRDAVLPGILLALILLSEVAFGTGRSAVLSVLLVLPLFWRRTHAELVVGAVASLATVKLFLGPSFSLGDLAIPVAVYSAGAFFRDRRWGWAAAGYAVLGAVTSIVGRGSVILGYGLAAERLIAALFATLVIVGAFLLGLRDAGYQQQTVAAQQERERLLTQDRDQQIAMAAADERTRIARELHDIVAHSLSVVIVQADGGRAAAERKPEVAQQVLDTISETARAALADMRRLVGVLRSGAGAEDEHPDYAPAPTMDDIDELVQQVRRAGQDVSLLLRRTDAAVPAGVGLTAYRVVQESLTNVLKHAGPGARAEVTVTQDDQHVQITVLDDGRGAAVIGDGQGNGQTGMRERVNLHGGSMTAQPRAGGGYLVTVTIPLVPDASDGPDRPDAG